MEDDAPEPVLQAIRIARTGLDLVPGTHERAWMDDTPGAYANRCLPMLLANQAGWDIRNDGAFTATWNGGSEPGDVAIETGDEPPSVVPISHFGSGIITWHVPYLFRTPLGWNLLARGPANAPKDGIAALEGIVETDWSAAPFTMNWKLTRPGLPVTFRRGETICTIVPQRRGELERFATETREMHEMPELRRAFRAWRTSRNAFIADPENKPGWQKHYFRGVTVEGDAAPEHQTRLHLRAFAPAPKVSPTSR